MEQKIEQLLGLVKEYGKMKKVYLSCYELLSILRDELRISKYELKDMVNFIYVIREISRLADDLRKEADGIGHMFENVLCAVYVTANETGPIRASLATGTPDLKLGVKVPNQKREPERFQKLMTHFGISKEVISARVVKPYWPGICEQVSRLAEEGKPLPPGINPDDTYPTYKVRVKMIQNLDELMKSVVNEEVKVEKEVKFKETKLMRTVKIEIAKVLKEARRKETEVHNLILTTR